MPRLRLSVPPGLRPAARAGDVRVFLSHLRRTPTEAEEQNQGPRELNVYKKHECPITRGLIARRLVESA